MSKDQRFSAVSNVSLTSEEATEHIIAIYRLSFNAKNIQVENKIKYK